MWFSFCSCFCVERIGLFDHGFELRLIELGCCNCPSWSKFAYGVFFRWRFFFLGGWVGAVSILGEVNRLQRITRLICRDVAYHGTKIWILWCWVLINWAVGLKNLFFIMVVICGMFFTGVPFLVAFVGAIVIGFIRRSSFCWFRVFSMWFAVLSSWCVPIFVILPWLLSWWVVMKPIWPVYCRFWMSMKLQFHLFIGIVGCCLGDMCFCRWRPLNKTLWRSHHCVHFVGLMNRFF